VRTVTVRDLQKKVKECIDLAQVERVVIARRGRSAALLMGVEGEDWETVVLQSDPEFWKLIAERGRQPGIPFDEMVARFAAGEEIPEAASPKKPVRRRTRPGPGGDEKAGQGASSPRKGRSAPAQD
jgi:antitoxin (DNA-binding transcriptional repressor) of toxin-antitoxin stability system